MLLKRTAEIASFLFRHFLLYVRDLIKLAEKKSPCCMPYSSLRLSAHMSISSLSRTLGKILYFICDPCPQGRVFFALILPVPIGSSMVK